MTNTFDEKIQLFGKNCPRDNNRILVNCPSVEQEIDCETDCDKTTLCGPKNGNCTDVGALIPLEGTYKCQGSIQLYTQGQDDGELGVSSFARKKYRNLKKKVLKRKNVYHFEIGGDCCWELYGGTRFSGNSLILGNGGHQESLKPGSMKKRFCKF